MVPRRRIARVRFGAALAAVATAFGTLSAGCIPLGPDAIRAGRTTCSPPHTESKPSCSARRQISREDWGSVPTLLAKARPNFIAVSIDSGIEATS